MSIKIEDPKLSYKSTSPRTNTLRYRIRTQKWLYLRLAIIMNNPKMTTNSIIRSNIVPVSRFVTSGDVVVGEIIVVGLIEVVGVVSEESKKMSPKPFSL